MVCGVWVVVCGLWFVAYFFLSYLFILRFVMCGLWFVVCVESASCAFELVSRAIPLS